MNEDPRGTVRRSASGSLLVREFLGDEWAGIWCGRSRNTMRSLVTGTSPHSCWKSTRHARHRNPARGLARRTCALPFPLTWNMPSPSTCPGMRKSRPSATRCASGCWSGAGSARASRHHLDRHRGPVPGASGGRGPASSPWTCGSCADDPRQPDVPRRHRPPLPP